MRLRLKACILGVLSVLALLIMTNIANLSYSIYKNAVQRNYFRNDSKPHILLIVVDDFGFNDVGYHGSNIETPFLDKLALSGVRLENYYVQAVCSPTRGALLTGRYPIHTGLQRAIYPGQPVGLSLDHPTLADKLRESGYSTHIVGKWHVGFHDRRYLPTNRGFDSFFGFYNGYTDYFTHVSAHFDGIKGFDLFENENPVNWTEYEGYYSTELFASKTIDIIQRHDPQKPLFMYLPLQAVHSPIQAPKEYIKMKSNSDLNIRDILEGMVRCIDHSVKNVVDAMKQRGLWENTILVFFSDNGAPNNTGASNWPLKGFKGSGWEGGVRSVGFVHSELLSKGVIGTVFKELMHVTDWFPTFLNLAGGSYNSTSPLDGFDQWQSLKYGIPSQRKEILHDLLPGDLPTQPFPDVMSSTKILRRVSMRIGDWKILKMLSVKQPAAGQMNETKRSFLYNIAEDPEEKNDLSKKHRTRVKEMLQRLNDYWKGMVPSPNPAEDPQADPRLRKGFWEPWIN